MKKFFHIAYPIEYRIPIHLVSDIITITTEFSFLTITLLHNTST